MDAALLSSMPGQPCLRKDAQKKEIEMRLKKILGIGEYSGPNSSCSSFHCRCPDCVKLKSLRAAAWKAAKSDPRLFLWREAPNGSNVGPSTAAGMENSAAGWEREEATPEKLSEQGEDTLKEAGAAAPEKAAVASGAAGAAKGSALNCVGPTRGSEHSYFWGVGEQKNSGFNADIWVHHSYEFIPWGKGYMGYIRLLY